MSAPPAERQASRRAVLLILTALTALGPLATDLYLPAMPLIAAELSASPALVQLTISVFLIGFGLGQFFFGPASDRFGRRPMILLGMGLFALATAFCVAASSIEALLFGRFFQGLGACAGPVLARAVVRDLFDEQAAAKAQSYLAAAMAVAPILGPALSGYAMGHVGWQAGFVLLLIWGMLCIGATLFALPETNRRPDPDALQPAAMFANYGVLLRHPRYRLYVLSAASCYGGLFSFLTGSSFVLMDQLGLGAAGYGTVFGATASSFVIGSLLSGWLLNRLELDRVIATGALIGLVGGLGGVGMVLAGLVSVPAIVGGACLFLFGMGMVLPNSFAGALAPFPQIAGAASALLGVCQIGAAALVGTLVGQLYDGTALPMTGLIAAATVLCLISALLLQPTKRLTESP